MQAIESANKNTLDVDKAEKGLNPVQSHTFTIEKTGRSTKKNSLKQKKKVKAAQRQMANSTEELNQQIFLKNKSDQDNSATNNESVAQKTKTNPPSIKKINLSLNLLVHKPPYISISNSNRICGDFGHSSVIFKRPFIEGVYFLEVVVKEEWKKNKSLAYKSAVRVGICHHAFNYSFPLGCQQSVAYKSSDGSVIKGGEKIGQGEPYSYGDVLGMLIKISPPQKHPNAKEISEDSTISFFKNGKLMFEFKELKQVFYCFGVSLFNYSQVEILSGPSSRYPMPQQSKHYYSIFNQQILYADLKNNKLFKI